MAFKDRIYRFLEHLTRALLFKLQGNRNQENTTLAIFNDFVGAEIMAYGIYEKEELNVLENILPENVKSGIALDIGANIGNHSLKFASFFTHVHAFEPHPITYSLLKINTHGFHNISIYPYGLSNQDKTSMLYYSRINFGKARIGGESQEEEVTIILKKGDDVVAPNVGFIKIDVEGHEPEVLIGLKGTIERNKPIICFEYNLEDKVDKNALNILEEYGYTRFYVPRKKSMFKSHRKHSFLKLLIDELFFNTTYRIQPLSQIDRQFYNMVIAIHQGSEYQLKLGDN